MSIIYLRVVHLHNRAPNYDLYLQPNYIGRMFDIGRALNA